MARAARVVVPGHPHQVTQWGGDGRAVFVHPADYERYLDWLRLYACRYGLSIWAYCLMPDHVLFVCVPSADDALARTFNAVHMRYAQYFKGRYARDGSLWSGRFLSCALDGPSCFEEIRYVETSPVRAGLAARPEDYPWSSARFHVLALPDPLVADCSAAHSILDWRAYLAASPHSGEGEAIVRRTRVLLRTGRPSGSASFVRALESVTGRTLTARPRGRPRKTPPPSPPGSSP